MSTERLAEIESFYGEKAENFFWFKRWDKVVDVLNQPDVKWFPGGLTNYCYNALDRHVVFGLGDRIAVTFISPILTSPISLTYNELLIEVCSFAYGLVKLGVQKGDVVGLFLPKTKESLIAILGCARIGAVFSFLSGAALVEDIVKRMDHIKPKVVITCDVGIYFGQTFPMADKLVEAIRQGSHKPNNFVLIERKAHQADFEKNLNGVNSMTWTELVSETGSIQCAAIESNEPFCIMFTSGTTGLPKGLVFSTAGQMLNNVNSAVLQQSNLLDYVYLCTCHLTTIASINLNLTVAVMEAQKTIWFEGETSELKETETILSALSEMEVTHFYCVPIHLNRMKTLISNSMSTSEPKYRLNSIGVYGINCTDSTRKWAMKYFDTSFSDIYGSSESRTIRVKYWKRFKSDDRPSIVKPVGVKVKIMNKNLTEEVLPGQVGGVFLELPMNISSATTFYQNYNRFVESYFAALPGHYNTKDAGLMNDGELEILGRGDDVIRLFTGTVSPTKIEEAIDTHPDVMTSAVIGVEHNDFSEFPMAFYVLKPEFSGSPDSVSQDLVQMVEEKLGKTVCFQLAIPLMELPISSTGKVVKRVLRDIVNGFYEEKIAEVQENGIVNKNCLNDIKEAVTKCRYLPNRY